MKKTVVLLLIAAIVLSLAACGTPSAGPTPNSPAPGTAAPPTGGADPAAPEPAAYKGKTLTIASNQLPESLIIQTIKPTTGTLYVLPALYATLYTYNEADELVPGLATGYEWADETHLRVFLRDDAYATNGDKLTAEDVKYSFTLGQDGVNASSYAEVADVIVEDEYTAVIVLKSPSPTFTENLNGAAFSIVSKSGVEADGGVEKAALAPYSCTSGPYKFSEWKEGQYIILEYNENFYDKDYVPSYEFIKYIAIADNASRCLAVQSGDADIAAGITLPDTMGYANSETVKVATVPTNLSTVLWFNCNKGIFTNPDLRKALGYLIDWQECADVVTGGGSKLNDASFPRSSQYFYDGWTRTKDIEKGKELLAKAGYPDGFDFEIKTAGPQAHHTNVALLIQAQLAEVGINVTVTPLDLGVWFGTIDSGDFVAHMGNSTSMFSIQMAYYDDVNTRLQNFGGPQLSDPYVTDLVKKARTEFDFATRKGYTDKLQEYMIENRIGYGICDEVGYLLYSSKLQDISSEKADMKPQFVRPAS